MINVLKSVFKIIYRVLLNLTIPILILFATAASLVVTFLVKYITYNQTYTNIAYLLIGLITVMIVSKIMHNNRVNPLGITFSLPVTLLITFTPTYIIFTEMGYSLEDIYRMIIDVLGREVVIYLLTTGTFLLLGSCIKYLLDITLKGEKQVKKQELIEKKMGEKNGRVESISKEVIDNSENVDIWEDTYLQRQDV